MSDVEFLKEHGVISVKTLGELTMPKITLIVEFNNGDIEMRNTNLNMIDVNNVFMNILNIRSRKKKLLKITKTI